MTSKNPELLSGFFFMQSISENTGKIKRATGHLSKIIIYVKRMYDIDFMWARIYNTKLKLKTDFKMRFI